MSTRLTRSPEFLQDVERFIAWYIEQNEPERAVRFGRAIDETLEMLALFPEIGSPYESAKPAHRSVRFEIVRRFSNHVIFYWIGADEIQLMRVFHGHQNIEELL